MEVSGGRLLGLGSACPYNEIGYVTDRTDTYYGEALAVAQAGETGILILRATNGALRNEVTIKIDTDV